MERGTWLETPIDETKDKEQLLKVWGDIVVDQHRSSQLDEVEGGKEGRKEGRMEETTK